MDAPERPHCRCSGFGGGSFPASPEVVSNGFRAVGPDVSSMMQPRRNACLEALATVWAALVTTSTPTAIRSMNAKWAAFTSSDTLALLKNSPLYLYRAMPEHSDACTCRPCFLACDGPPYQSSSDAPRGRSGCNTTWSFHSMLAGALSETVVRLVGRLCGGGGGGRVQGRNQEGRIQYGRPASFPANGPAPFPHVAEGPGSEVRWLILTCPEDCLQLKQQPIFLCLFMALLLECKSPSSARRIHKA